MNLRSRTSVSKRGFKNRKEGETYAAKTKVHHVLLEGDRKPENPYYLDEAVMDHFALFLTLCDLPEQR